MSSSSSRSPPAQRRPPLQPGQRRLSIQYAVDGSANTTQQPSSGATQTVAHSNHIPNSRFGTPIPTPTTPTRSTGYLHRGLASDRTKTPPPTLGVRRRAAPVEDDNQHYPPHYRFAHLTAPGGGRQQLESKEDPAAQAEAIRRDALIAALDASSSAAARADAEHRQSTAPIADEAWMCTVLQRHLPPSVTKYQHGGERPDTTIQRRSSGATLIIPTASEPIADWVQTIPSRNYVSDMVAAQAAASSRTPRRLAGGGEESDIRKRQRMAMIEASKLQADSTMFSGAVSATVARNKGVANIEQEVWRAQQVRVNSEPSSSSRPLVGASRHSTQSTTGSGRAALHTGSSLPIALSPRSRPLSPSRQASPQRAVGTTTSHAVRSVVTGGGGSRVGSPRDGRTRSPSTPLRRHQVLLLSSDEPLPHQSSTATPRTGPLLRRVLMSSPQREKAGWLLEGTLINGSTARPYSSNNPTSTPTTEVSAAHPRHPRATTPTTPLRPYLQPPSPRASPDKRDTINQAMDEYVPQRSVFDEEERLHSRRQVVVGRRHVTVSKAKEVDVVAKKRLLFGLDLQTTPSYSFPQRQQPSPAPIQASRHDDGDEYRRLVPESIFSTTAADTTLYPGYTSSNRSSSARTVETSAVGSRGLGAAKRRIHAHNELQAEIRHLEEVSELSQRTTISVDEATVFRGFPAAERKDRDLIQRALEVAAKRIRDERSEQERWAEERRSGQRRSCWGQQAAMRTALEEQWANFHGHIVRNFSLGVSQIEGVVAPEVAVRSLVLRREAQLRGKIAALRTLCESTMFKVATGQQASTLHPAMSPPRSSNAGNNSSTSQSPPPSSHSAPAPQPTPHPISAVDTTPTDLSLGNLSGISQASATSTGLPTSKTLPTSSHDEAMVLVSPQADGEIDDQRRRRAKEAEEDHESINRSRGMSVADGAAADMFEVLPASSNAVMQRFLSHLGNTPLGNALADQDCVRSTFHGRYHELITFEVCREFGVMFAGGTVETASPGSRGANGPISFPSTRRLPQEYDGFRRVAPAPGTFLPFESVFPTTAARKKERATTVSIIANEGDGNATGPSAEASMAMNAITNAVCDVALNQFVQAELGRMVANALEATTTDSE